MIHIHWTHTRVRFEQWIVCSRTRSILHSKSSNCTQQASDLAKGISTEASISTSQVYVTTVNTFEGRWGISRDVDGGGFIERGGNDLSVWFANECISIDMMATYRFLTQDG